MRSLKYTRAVALLALAAGYLTACEDPAPPKEAESTTAQKPLVPAPAPQAPDVAEAPKEEVATPKQERKAVVCPPAPRVAFSDAALEAEVRRKASKPEGDVTLADLKKVRSVDLTRAGTKVDTLDPCIFPLLTNLHHLYLGGGELTDLSPIKTLTKLEGLRVSMNQVADLTPLAGMVQMDRLDLGRTQVMDLKPLRGMTKMTELMLDDTPVTDLSPLAGLTKLERLSIKRTRVRDLSPLKPLSKLKFLYVAGSAVEDTHSVARPGLKISSEE